MKKIKFWSIVLAMAVSLPLLNACGGDDDGSHGDGNSSGLVDGVHVNSRKLLSLDVYKGENSSYKRTFTMTYDSKGKLSQIKSHASNIDDYYYADNDITLLSIDYDLKFMEFFDDIGYKIEEGMKLKRYYSYDRCFFTLNDKGYISRLGDCELTYNNDGYLVGANTVKDMWTFAYSEGDIIKYMMETLKSGNIDLYYANYGEKQGELYFSVNVQKKFSDTDWKWHYSDYYATSLLILYHAGLFGNISKHCSTLPKNGIVEQISDKDKSNLIIHCSFVFDK